MHTLTFTFKVLSLCGVWLPLGWSGSKRLCYNIFSALVIVGTYILVTMQGLLLLLTEFDINFFTDIMFTFLTAVSVCAKALNFWLRRAKIVCLAEMLLKSWCIPRDEVELVIEKKTDHFIRMFTIVFNALGQLTLFCQLIIPLLQEKEHRELPFRAWLPYELHQGWNYWWTYGLEIVPMILGVLLNVTTDVLVSGFVLQACTQMEILKRRLKRLPELVSAARGRVPSRTVRVFESRTLRQAIMHHEHIMKYTKAVTEIFDVIIVEQFFASVLVFSVIVYVLSVSNVVRMQKIMAVGYLICMTVELFSYCWFGNEITIKTADFADDIYDIDWTVLSAQSNKTLMFIMLRSSRPIIMRYGHLVILNVESFKSILKVTYTAFNVLKESSDT